jgi:hypothetical protein
MRVITIKSVRAGVGVPGSLLKRRRRRDFSPFMLRILHSMICISPWDVRLPYGFPTFSAFQRLKLNE